PPQTLSCSQSLLLLCSFCFPGSVCLALDLLSLHDALPICLAFLQRYRVVGYVRAGVVLFKALGTEGPGTVDLGIRLLPGRVRTEAGNDVKVRSAAFTLAPGLEWGVRVGVQPSNRILGEHAVDCR